MVHLTSQNTRPDEAQVINQLNLEIFDAWQIACQAYFSTLLANRSLSRKTSKGLQRLLNESINQLMDTAGWQGGNGRWRKESIVVRFSFRHKMSLGSDFFDALRLCSEENLSNYFLVYASTDALKVINPDEVNTLCSSEAAEELFTISQKVLNIPVKVVKLSVGGDLPSRVHNEIYARSRLEGPRGSVS